ncbi:hypothetical protein V7079_22815 [Priestia megaterium]|uniref:Uncharacterized protein n=2 Tax=Priestia TaxID=2800373 RepID=A0AA86IHF7_PRIMG|nr:MULTISPECIES: hypothetical protein [Priestia]AXI29438.1 hypothetical protein CIB87_10600 [Priestia megaterium]UMZ35538.1 hypothetical protein MGJ28_12965 [Priestia megaterium]WEA46798.1 hypothetical protein PWO00_12800 [Priestia aryabhattai]
MDLTNVNVDVLLAAYRQKLGITEEEEQQMIAEIQEGSAPTQDMSNIGEMVAINMEDNQAVAEMVSSLMMDVQQLRDEVEELKK